jgi:O-succinylbenzoic acid--CoA ligase
MFKNIEIQFFEIEDNYRQKVLSYKEKLLSKEPQYIFYSSGTTGVPKSIVLEYNKILVSAGNTNGYFNLQSNHIFLLCLNVDFIAGFMVLARAMLAGAKLMVVSPSSHPFDQINSHFDFVSIVPAQIENIESNISKFNQSKPIVLIGGADISKSQLEILEKNKINAYQSYGMTETISHIALKKPTETYYHTLGDVQISTDERGCLVIDSRLLLNNKLVTNDLVEIKNEKEFEFRGRIDHVINSGAIKINLSKVHEIVQDLTLIPTNKIVVTSEENMKWGQIPIIIFEKNFLPNAESLKIIFKNLNQYFKSNIFSIKNIRTIDAIQYTFSQKVDVIKNKELAHKIN